MNRLRAISLAGLLMAVGLSGCAAGMLPPSESTMVIVRSYKAQLDSKVASGQLAPAQARDMYYAKLGEIQPPLPELGGLVEFRKQATAQVEAGTLTPEQAESRLASRESEMMARWEEMAARYAKEQRGFNQIQNEYERGLRQQQMPVGGRPF